MQKILEYLNFLKDNGRKVSEMNPGSDEYALSPENALIFINLLRENHIPILGGDILSEDNEGRLMYAHHLWGNKYVYLIWSCDKIKDENQTAYVNRSYTIAKDKIISANKVATQLKKNCYIVLII